MFISKSQIKLFKDILEDFELTPTPDDRVLGQIYQYLFSEEFSMPTFADTTLLETIHALKDIVEMEHITTLEGLIVFFKDEDQAIDDYMIGIVEEINNAWESANSDHDSLYSEPEICLVKPEVAVQPALSRYVVTSNDYKNEYFVEEFKNNIDRLRKYFISRLRRSAVDEHLLLVDDLVQETAMKAWKTYYTSRVDKYTIKSLLFKVAASELSNSLNKLERRKAMQSHYIILMDHSLPSVESAFEARDLLEYLKQIINGPGYSIMHYYLAGLTLMEIAMIHNITVSNVRARIWKSKNKIKKLLITSGMLK